MHAKCAKNFGPGLQANNNKILMIHVNFEVTI